MYLYPMHIDEELIDTIAGAKKVLPYLDLPLQHINDEVLRRMRRRVDRAETVELLARLRKGIPRLVMRTTFIAGFPGETDEQFAELLAFVRTEKFERLGAFSYCEEENTPAFELDGAIPQEIRNQRRDRLLAAQQPIAFAWNKSQVGRRHEVIIDSRIPGQKNAYIGRSYADAPEIDGVVYVTGENLKPGQIVRCEIVTTNNYDLIAVVC
jgi:ribosomal protein S12 methylthiotransferase